jgi:hypothetical protein
VSLQADVFGDAEARWDVKADEGDEARMLVRELRSGRHRTQRSIAAALGWDPSKATRLKRRAIADKMIEPREWEAYLGGVPADPDDEPPAF